MVRQGVRLGCASGHGTYKYLIRDPAPELTPEGGTFGSYLLSPWHGFAVHVPRRHPSKAACDVTGTNQLHGTLCLSLSLSRLGRSRWKAEVLHLRHRRGHPAATPSELVGRKELLIGAVWI